MSYLPAGIGEKKMRLNEKRRCSVCERKPLVYKRYGYRFCTRCCRAFHIETGEQVENFGWRQIAPGVFEPRSAAS
jgi:hypothetical protein